jgi:hypothetical protein
MTRVMRSWMTQPIRRRMSVGMFVVASATAAGCATSAPATPGPQSPTPGADSSRSAGPPQTPSAGAAPSTSPSPAGAQVAARRLPEVVLDPKQPLRPLPELRVENIGLHIGGGPNDAETKAPFLNAVAARFPAFMDCYRKNEEPAQGGRFGVDLHVGRSGGHPRIEQPRTSLRGADFRACLGGVFESVDFQKPKHGPTTLSYSLRFTLVEAP